MWTIKLPYPPSVNHQYIHSKYGVRLSTETKVFRKTVWALANGMPKFDERDVAVMIYLFPGSKRRVDIDNPVKAILDALEGVNVFADDTQVQRLYVVKKEASKPGYVLVKIKEMNNAKI